ncbi:MAG: asparaginase [Chloroflexi bacterium]|nr:MAG: asparaginase [Chloroflexota bacterium]
MHLEAGLPVLVELTRGGVVESRHRGAIAVADARGRLRAWAGDPDFLTFPRSALKPFQAIVAVESGAADRFGFGHAELAVCCGSHSGEPRHRDVVAGMLERARVPLDALCNGVAEPINDLEFARYLLGLVEKNALFQNCSGKHAGILAACRALDLPLDAYDNPQHPIQQRIRAATGDCFHLPSGELLVGIDGCTLPTFGAPLRNVAIGWAAIAEPDPTLVAHAEALERLADAMVAEPWMVAGTGRLDTVLSEATQGRIIAKGGAEGVLCVAVRDKGLGIAFKIEDGSHRAHGVIVHSILRQLGALSPSEDGVLARLFPTTLNSNRAQHVGDMYTVFELEHVG